jgi:uncharacterized lipoprotein YbaY
VAGPALCVVSGTVSSRERIALPPGAVVTVRVAEVSRADIAVWARLRSAVGTWVSDTHTPVLTPGAGDTADVVVRRGTEA